MHKVLHAGLYIVCSESESEGDNSLYKTVVPFWLSAVKVPEKVHVYSVTNWGWAQPALMLCPLLQNPGLDPV